MEEKRCEIDTAALEVSAVGLLAELFPDGMQLPPTRRRDSAEYGGCTARPVKTEARINGRCIVSTFLGIHLRLCLGSE